MMKVWIAITLIAAASCSVWASKGGFETSAAIPAAQSVQQE